MHDPDSKLSRRKVFAGAGAAGALVAVAAAVPLVKADPRETKADTAAADDRTAGGYQLTEHVKQYYRTARI